MKYKNWLLGALLIVAGVLGSNAVLVMQGVDAVAADVQDRVRETERPLAAEDKPTW